MKRKKIIVIALCIITILNILSGINLINAINTKNNFLNNYDFKPGELIIKFKNQINPELFFKNLRDKKEIISVENKFKSISTESVNNVYLIKTSNKVDILSLIEELSQNSNIEYVEPNYLRYLDYLPNDIYFNQQWALYNTGQFGGTLKPDIDVTDSWNITYGKEVTVAVIDTGIDYNHLDLINNIWINVDEILNNNIDDDNNGFIDDIMGWDFAYNDNDPIDDYGHGTQCSGIIAAEGDNYIGIAGLNWNCKIMPIKALDSGGYADAVSISESIIYAADNGADIISMSLGWVAYSSLEEEAINYAYSKNIIIIASAGNDNSHNRHYPAYYENVISVSSVDNNYNKSSFSNHGKWIDIAAPGEDIFTTYPGNHYSYFGGTSASAPFVAGVSALLLTRDPYLLNYDLKSIIKNNTDPYYSNGYYIGVGVINSYKSLINIENIPPLKPNKPLGPYEGEINKSLNFSTISIDPNSDKIYYLWDWGDGNISEWIGPYSSNDTCIINHTWLKGGNYSIIVKSKDYFDSESNWSEPFVVRIPKIKSMNELKPWLFKLIQRISILEVLL